MIEFDGSFGADRPRATSGDHGHDKFCESSCLSSMARRKGAQYEYVVQGMLNYIDTRGLAKAELKCDQEPSTMWKSHGMWNANARRQC